MDAIEELTQRIPAFPAYADEDTRRLSDEYVRSYLGERLADLQTRLEPPGDAGEQLEALILRCEFTNQRAINAFEAAQVDGPYASMVAAADACVVQVADQAATVDGASLAAYMAEVQKALDARDSAMENLSTRG
jgi:hypothetical protein